MALFMVKRSTALSDGDLAELLARHAEESSGILVRAFRRAARSAFLWPERAADLLAAGRALTELHGVGPFIAKQLRAWIENPPARRLTIPALRRDFLTDLVLGAFHSALRKKEDQTER